MHNSERTTVLVHKKISKHVDSHDRAQWSKKSFVIFVKVLTYKPVHIIVQDPKSSSKKSTKKAPKVKEEDPAVEPKPIEDAAGDIAMVSIFAEL